MPEVIRLNSGFIRSRMRVFRAVFLILVALHAALLFLGGANVLTMLLFYTSTAWICVYLVNHLKGRIITPSTSANIRIVIISTTITLVAAELFLRYVKQDFKSYTELNGSFNFVSEKIQRRALGLLNHFIPNAESSWFHTRDPHGRVNYHSPEFEYSGEYYNSLGLREAELSNYPGEQKNLVIGLGDSFTEGVGAPFDSAWIKQLQYLLSRKGFHLKTLNAGVQGSDPLFGYMLLKYKLADYKPSLVIVAINTTDIDDIISMGGRERFRDNFSVKYKPPLWWEYFYSFSFIVRNIAHGIFKMDWQLLTKQQKEAEEEKAKNELIECIKKFKEYSIQKQFKLLFVFHPLANEIENHSFKLDDVCRKTDSLMIPYVDLYSWFLEHGINERNVYDYYWKTDLHHNSKGYGMWAQAVAEKIMSDRLMD